MRWRTRTVLMQASIWVTIVSALGALIGCGGSRSTSQVVVGEGSGRFPDHTLSDWVSYADQLSVVLVTAQEALPADNGTLARGEGYIGRIVTLKINRTLWTRESTGPSAKGNIRIVTYGWVLQDGMRYQFAGLGGPRLEVGRRYVLPLVRAPRDGVAWTALSVASTIPLEGALMTTERIIGQPSRIASSLEGRAPAALARLLARTPPDPIAARFWRLSPDARVHAVLRARPAAD
jgi:hypothetical protein